MAPEYNVYASKNDKSVTNNNNSALDTLSSSQEEANTKMVFHLHHGVKYGNVKMQLSWQMALI